MIAPASPGTVALPMTGTCQCGALRYAITVQPLTLYLCHCTDCQKQSASAFAMSLLVAADGITVLSGQMARWQRSLADGRVKTYRLCKACGTRLFHETSGRDNIWSVKAGTLDQARSLLPCGEIWTASAHAWARQHHFALSYPGQPDSYEALFAAWRNRN